MCPWHYGGTWARYTGELDLSLKNLEFNRNKVKAIVG